MNAVMKQEEGDVWLDGLSNDEYHKPEHGLSTSNVKAFLEDPAQIVWAKNAPQDKDAMPAIDFGTDFHAYFLEPDLFKETYKVLPEFNRRKKEEKEEELALIKQWEDDGITAVTHEDMAKLEWMRDSALANPTVKAIMNLNGVAERSFFWTDERTGVRCKCRPDYLVTDINDNNRLPFMLPDEEVLIADVKTIAQMDKLQAQVENLKYFVQDPFYKRGISQVLGKKCCFVFIFVSTTRALGRYPVQVVKLTDTAVFDGTDKINEALLNYSQYLTMDESVWQTVVELDRPSWATREEEIY